MSAVEPIATTVPAPKRTKTKPVPDPVRDLGREVEAAEVLLGSLREIAAGDEDFLADLVEGETGLFEIIAKIDASELDDQIVVTGCKAAVAKLQERQRKAESRIELKRTMITVALEQIGLKTHRTAIGTYSLSYPQPAAEVVDEAEIPCRFWIKADPKLDKKALTEAVRNRSISFAETLAVAEHIENEAERAAAIAAAEAAHPEIPGAVLGAPTAKLTIRR